MGKTILPPKALRQGTISCLSSVEERGPGIAAGEVGRVRRADVGTGKLKAGPEGDGRSCLCALCCFAEDIKLVAACRHIAQGPSL